MIGSTDASVHLAAARASLEAAASLGDRTAAHCLRVLQGAHQRGGRPPHDDTAALVTLQRLGYSRGAVSIAARVAPNPTGKLQTAERRLRRKAAELR